MSAVDSRTAFVRSWTARCHQLLGERNNLTPEEIQDLAVRLDKLRDDKLKTYVATLLGWGDTERIELMHFCTVALQLMEDVRPSVLRAAVSKVETRHLVRAHAVKALNEEKS